MLYIIFPFIYYFFTAANPFVAPACFTCRDAPAGTIFCDDFETDEDISNRYFGYDNNDREFIRMNGVGRNGSTGMRVRWQKGEVEAGVLQKSIGN